MIKSDVFLYFCVFKLRIIKKIDFLFPTKAESLNF